MEINKKTLISKRGYFCMAFTLLCSLIIAQFIACSGNSSLEANAKTELKVPEDYGSIQEAIYAADDGATVLVGDGTFTEDILINIILLEDKSVTLKSVNGNSATTISGSIVFENIDDDEDSSATITIDGITVSGEYNGLSLHSQSADNFIISNCIVTNSEGVACGSREGNVSITDTDVTDNKMGIALGGGDGEFYFGNSTGSVTVSGCDILNNADVFDKGGGGIYGSELSGTVIIKNSTIAKNSTTFLGGGIHFFGTEPNMLSITNCEIIDNIAENGGGMYFEESFPIIINCTIADNTAQFNGGGMFCWSARPKITNSIFWGNSATTNDEVFLDERSFATVTYSDIKGGYTGTGNINSPPFFDILSSNKYQLRTGSPCIDTGAASYTHADGTVTYAPTDDRSNNARPQGSGVDMGCYESTLTSLRVPSEYATIQSAIDAAATDNTILVSSGIYGSIDFKGKAVTVKSLDGAFSTVINGGASGSAVSFKTGEASSSELYGFTVTNGSAVNGGGILCDGASPRLVNCIIESNTASSAGGGVYCTNSSAPVIVSCTISANTATGNGGAVALASNSSATLLNSILWGNTATPDNEIYYDGTSSVTVSYSDVELTSGTYTGTGNINSDPLFVNPASKNFHLRGISPCINSGKSTGGSLDDADGEERPQLNGYDMGADEVTPITVSKISGDYDSIQDAIDAAVNGSLILVNDGEYFETINFVSKDITLQSVNGATDTIINGQQIDSVVTFDSGETADALLDGFTITNGATALVHGGGGIYIDSSSPTIQNCNITANRSFHSPGGGVSCDNTSTPLIKDCIITDNITVNNSGGGVSCDNFSDATIDNCTISDNTADSGGGLYIIDSEVTITGGTLTGNFASTLGGGFYYVNKSYLTTTLSNVTINGNSTDGNGGGIYIDNPSAFFASLEISGGSINSNSAFSGGGIYAKCTDVTLTGGTTIDTNTAEFEGGGVYLEEGDLTITGGTLTGNSAYKGGGAKNLSGVLTITDCAISDNSVSGFGIGGGLYLTALTTLTDCDITGNSAYDGGGIYIGTDPAASLVGTNITGGTISGNSAAVYPSTGDGGGIFCSGAQAVKITNVDITENSAYRGGGIDIYNAPSAWIRGCTITGNTSDNRGSGINMGGNVTSKIINCTIADNIQTYSSGAGFYLDFQTTPEVYNTILWGNTATSGAEILVTNGSVLTITYSDIQGGGFTGTGNINSDPLFVGGGDYHIKYNSPCIDASIDDAYVPNDDVDGNARPIDGDGLGSVGTEVDMGVDEVSGIDADGDLIFSDYDCNDSDASIYPGATEVCGDGIDNDCDGQIDEGC